MFRIATIAIIMTNNSAVWFNVLLTISIITSSLSLYSQNGSVGIGTESPDNSALLHLVSGSKGFLAPSMTMEQRNQIQEPAFGLLIFQTDNTPGFYYYNGSQWIALAGGGASGSFWNEGGNTLTGASATYIGTLNDYPFGIHTNNQERFKLDASGKAAFSSDFTGETLTIGGRAALKETTAPSATVAGFGTLYADEDNNALYYNSSDGVKSQISYEYAIFQDRKSSGTNGGTFSSGSWVTRDLNTVAAFRGASISLNTANSRITLLKGVYRVSASAPAFRINRHKARLMKISGDGTLEIYGTSEFITNSYDIQSRSHIEGIIEVTSDNAVYELQHRCSNDRTSTGLGYPSTFAVDEIYSVVYIQKIE